MCLHFSQKRGHNGTINKPYIPIWFIFIRLSFKPTFLRNLLHYLILCESYIDDNWQFLTTERRIIEASAMRREEAVCFDELLVSDWSWLLDFFKLAILKSRLRQTVQLVRLFLTWLFQD